MSLLNDLRSNVDDIIGNGKIVKFRYLNYTPAGSYYDDDITITQSGNDVYTMGLIQPIDKTRGSKDAALVENGRLLQNDMKMFVNGTVDTSGLWEVQIGSPIGAHYEVVPDGIVARGVNNQQVYKKLYLRNVENQRTSDLLSGLIAYWDFNISGTTFLDNRNSIIGSFVSGAGIELGINGSALQTPGSPCQFECGTFITNTLSGNNPFTLNLWVFGFGSTISNLSNYAGQYGGNYKGFKIGRNATLGIQYTVGYGNTEVKDYFFNPNTNIQWDNLAITGSNKISNFYLNGSLVGSYIGTNMIDNGYNQNFRLFRNPWDNLIFAESGVKVDNIMVYNRMLNNDDIQLIYSIGSKLIYPFKNTI
jgi:hypothetical protein